MDTHSSKRTRCEFIFHPSSENYRLVELVDRLQKLSSSPIIDNESKKAIVLSEREIDRLVYKLYDLTPEEIAIVEGEQNG